jgi:cell division septation protein DedD
LFWCLILKPAAAKIDKDAVRWSLSWHPEGRCDSFTREAILECAPPTSGVYGLFNFDCQVFIGESPNIQEALLRHESETDFQSRPLRPTGFTFEPCAAELRKLKADELIAKFRPVLQTEAALADTGSPPQGPTLTKTGLHGQELACYADHQEFPVHEREERPKVRRRFYFTRTQGTASAAMFVATAVVIFYLVMPADYAIQKRANGSGKPQAGISMQPLASDRTGLRPQSVSSIDTAGELAHQSAKRPPAKPDVHASVSTPNGAVPFAAKSASAADGTGIQAPSEPAKTRPVVHSGESADSSKKWSVQISAAPAKEIADTLVRRLKVNGYDGYIIQAEVKGQTYYRVRVGRFDTREQAESVRQSLAHQQGYRDAYLTGD